MLNKKSGDGWIALSVVACSIVLFIALALGLSGSTFVRDAHRLRVRFPDVTGIVVSSRVKYAGAPAGTVSAIRILTADERKETASNLVEVTLLLHADVPPLPKDAQISIAADTLLSDKFVLINAGSPNGPMVGPDDILQGLAPTTFDQLARDADDAINVLRRMVAGGEPAGARDLVARLQKILSLAESTLTDIKPIIGNADGLVNDARTTLSGARSAIKEAQSAAVDAHRILSDNKDRISRTVDKVASTATAFESLAKRGESLLRDNQASIARTLADFRITGENLKVTSAYSKFLLRDLAAHPNRLLWGNNPKTPHPSEDQILEKSR